MTNLIGSEKQITWAEKIRTELVEKFEKLEVADVNTYLEVNSKLSPNARISLAQTNIIVTRKVVTEIKNYILETKEEAKWYIEIGRDPILSVIKKVYLDEMIRNKGEKVQILFPEWKSEIKELF